MFFNQIDYEDVSNYCCKRKIGKKILTHTHAGSSKKNMQWNVFPSFFDDACVHKRLSVNEGMYEWNGMD